MVRKLRLKRAKNLPKVTQRVQGRVKTNPVYKAKPVPHHRFIPLGLNCRWFSLLPVPGHVTMSEDISGCHDTGVGVCYWHIVGGVRECRYAAKHPTRHQAASTTENRWPQMSTGLKLRILLYTVSPCMSIGQQGFICMWYLLMLGSRTQESLQLKYTLLKYTLLTLFPFFLPLPGSKCCLQVLMLVYNAE